MSRAEHIVVERSFDEKMDFESLQATETRASWCLERHNVRPVDSYVSLDGRSMVCLYTAPDAESVRETQRTGGLPFTRAWSCTLLTTTGARAARAGLSTVVVEREISTEISEADLARMVGESGPCFETNGVELLTSHCSKDLKRVICIFAAPDAEAVRRANREAGAPFTRAWTATHHEP